MSFLITAGPAHADWEGKFTVWIKNADGSTASQKAGQIKMRDEKARIDLKDPQEISAVIDTRTRKALNIIHKMKMAAEVDLGYFEVDAPLCGAKDVDGCLKRHGFKKTGEATEFGEPCAVYECKFKSRGRKKSMKIWRPLKQKEVPALRALITGEAGGKSIETVVTEIKHADQDEGLFKAPVGYRDFGNLDGLMKLFKGKK